LGFSDTLFFPFRTGGVCAPHGLRLLEFLLTVYHIKIPIATKKRQKASWGAEWSI
jgi:hypothetical protein